MDTKTWFRPYFLFALCKAKRYSVEYHLFHKGGPTQKDVYAHKIYSPTMQHPIIEE